MWTYVKRLSSDAGLHIVHVNDAGTRGSDTEVSTGGNPYSLGPPMSMSANEVIGWVIEGYTLAEPAGELF